MDERQAGKIAGRNALGRQSGPEQGRARSLGEGEQAGIADAVRAAIRQKARQLAIAAGKDWKGLSKEARRPFRRMAIREQARKLAKQEGAPWRNLSKEERIAFARKVIGKAPKSKAPSPSA